MPKLITFNGQTWYPSLTRYLSSPEVTCLVLVPSEPEQQLRENILVVSRNLIDAGHLAPRGCIHVKDYGENEGVLKALTDQGVLAFTSLYRRSGFAQFAEAQLLISEADCVALPEY